jgi:hypothetical protein
MVIQDELSNYLTAKNAEGSHLHTHHSTNFKSYKTEF